LALPFLLASVGGGGVLVLAALFFCRVLAGRLQRESRCQIAVTQSITSIRILNICIFWCCISLRSLRTVSRHNALAPFHLRRAVALLASSLSRLLALRRTAPHGNVSWRSRSCSPGLGGWWWCAGVGRPFLLPRASRSSAARASLLPIAVQHSHPPHSGAATPSIWLPSPPPLSPHACDDTPDNAFAPSCIARILFSAPRCGSFRLPRPPSSRLSLSLAPHRTAMPIRPSLPSLHCSAYATCCGQG
jgi:hypothetical protein